MGAMLKMKDLVPVKNEPSKLAGEENARFVFVRLAEALEHEQQVSMDLDGIESLSPSFAYEAFGKLVDRFGANVNARISFQNDPMHLSTRIMQAFERRRRVIEANLQNR